MITQPPHFYLLHGMKRSGNHAVINWLLPQLQCAHVNNFIPLGRILRGNPMPLPIDMETWRYVHAKAEDTPAQRLLVSLEDHALETEPFCNVRLPMTRLMVLRDARQLFSSRIRKASKVDMPAYPRSNDSVMARAVRTWKQHARVYLGESNDFSGRIAILFDAWFADPGYRAAISRALGVAFSDEGLQSVGQEGGGSSFDGVVFDGRSHLMKVNDRVSALNDRERALLDLLFADPELEGLCNRVLQASPLGQLQLPRRERPLCQ